MPKLSTFELLVVIGIILCIVIALSIPVPSDQITTEAPVRQAERGIPSHAQRVPSPPAETEVLKSTFCLDGCPTGVSAGDQLVTHHILQLENNPRTKFDDWVAYKITPEMMGSGCKRTWEEDPDLPDDVTLRPTDYKGIRAALASDRGHQAPLASLCGSPDWQEADYLSNITPQKSDLNEGTWERLENAERDLVKENVTPVVYSLTGPLYEREMAKLPYAHLETVTPSGYWKIVSYEEGGTLYAAAFVMDQDLQRETDFCTTNVMISNLEQRSHLKFFPLLKEDIDAKTHREDVMRALGC